MKVFQNISTIVQTGLLDVAARNFFCFQESLIIQILHLGGINAPGLTGSKLAPMSAGKTIQRRLRRVHFFWNYQWFKSLSYSNVLDIYLLLCINKEYPITSIIFKKAWNSARTISNHQNHSEVECFEFLQCIITADGNLNPNFGWQQSSWTGFNLSQIVQIGQNAQRLT